MDSTARLRLWRASSIVIATVSASYLAGCAGPPPHGMVGNAKRSKEYFAESEYGVKASPRVSWKKSNLPRGGGRDQIGKPYQVHGRMYYPKEEKNYRKVGMASWYGDAFHGRLTANGEIYDTTHLTAAHPTMPLPSYARVTNLENGSSVIVRVNDRGPYSDDRLIDLSRKAAEMLDYTRTGTAKVKVEYVGRAPLDGLDDQYLLASYHPGNKVPDSSDGLPAGVMVAMNGSTPSRGIQSEHGVAFPGALNDAAPSFKSVAVLTANTDLDLPAFGPIVPERPASNELAPTQVAFATMSYAPNAPKHPSEAFALLDNAGTPYRQHEWRRVATALPADMQEPFVAAATFEDRAMAERLAAALSPYGRTVLETANPEDRHTYSVNLFSDGRLSLDAMLEAAWQHGAPDAILVTD